MLTMGEFSAATRLTVKALRLYHDEGILVPERIDPMSGYRALFEAMIARGLHAATPSRELYLKGPGMILPRDPKRYVTEHQVPVATAAPDPSAVHPGGIDAD